MTTQPRYDAIVVGGGPAGLTAALYLGRSRRRTLVLDGGMPRNASASHAHGVFTRDGTPPFVLLDEARRQLSRYEEIEFQADEALSARGWKGRFTVRTAAGKLLSARRLLIACGVRDELPPIPGVSELWGTRIHPCVYCHGYEHRDGPLAVLVEAEAALAAAASLLNVSRKLVLCTNGSPLLVEDRERLALHSIRIIDSPLVRVDRTGDGVMLRFADGGRLRRSALFLKSTPRLASDLPAQLGCRLNGPAQVVVGSNWETDVPGVYAAGDIAADKKFVAAAAASGAEAAVALDGDLAQEDFGGQWSGPICANSRSRRAMNAWPPSNRKDAIDRRREYRALARRRSTFGGLHRWTSPYFACAAPFA